MSREWKAKLIGGPCDGQIVEVLGQCYMKKFCRKKNYQWFFFEAVYLWEVDNDNDSDGSTIGRFAGYYHGTTKVDKLGRRFGKRRKKQCT